MLPLRSGILAEAKSFASTSLQQRQSISLASFLQCPYLHQSRFPILILYVKYVINRQLKRECVWFLFMVENGRAAKDIVICIFLRIITVFLKNKFGIVLFSVFLSLDQNLKNNHNI